MNLALLTMARSRSSVIAEIFREHGVFFGDTFRPEDKRVGYNEHKWFKAWIKKARPELYGEILADRVQRVQSEGFEAQFEDRLREEGWVGGPWGVKADVFCADLFPSALKVGIFRDPRDIADSAMAALGRSMEDWTKIIGIHHLEIVSRCDRLINADEVVTGDDSSLRYTFDHLAIPYDKKITQEVLRRPYTSRHDRLLKRGATSGG